jgi:UDP-N-acetylglucosamine--N-acetylmuramyl-(pentapeptide) pyrophosphoryl-undecaprenol N-acetylglucosamine transferase
VSVEAGRSTEHGRRAVSAATDPVAMAPASRCIALATGGTAGHLSPALAVAAAYRARDPQARVLVTGNASGFAARLVEAHGYRLEAVPAAPFYRVRPTARLRAASQLLAGVRHARRVLTRERVQLVVGFGGYTSAGVVLAARSLGLVSAVHESNAAPGLSNRLLGRIVDRICLGELAAGTAFAPQRARVTGTPLRAEIARLAAEPRQPPRPGHLRMLVCGGSEGSPFLNHHAPELVRALRGRPLVVEVRHQSGREDAALVGARYVALGIDATVTAYLDDIAAAYRWADAVVTTAGAATLTELAAAGLPALLVPLGGAAADHQAANAAAFAAATGSAWMRESQWSAEQAAARLTTLHAEAWSAVAARSRALVRLDAADAIVAECEALLAGRC